MPIGVGLSSKPTPRVFRKTAAPTTGDDIGDAVLVGDIWIDQTADVHYTCADNSLGAAVWLQMNEVSASSTTTFTNKDLTDSTNDFRELKSITIESPTSTEDLDIFFTNKAITITEMRAVLVGSDTPSVTWTIRHGTDRSASGAEVVTSGTTTTSTTTGSDVTSFNDATIVADSFVWLETTAQSGTVTTLAITIFYDED